MPDEKTQQQPERGADAERAIPGKSAGTSAGERGAPEHAGRLPEQDLRDRALGDDAQRDVLP